MNKRKLDPMQILAWRIAGATWDEIGILTQRSVGSCHRAIEGIGMFNTSSRGPAMLRYVIDQSVNRKLAELAEQLADQVAETIDGHVKLLPGVTPLNEVLAS